MMSNLLSGQQIFAESVPKFVDTEWLAENIEKENIKVIDATIIFANPEGEFIESGYDLYLERHIPGAIFADLIAANVQDAPIPFTYPGEEQMKTFIASLGIQDSDYVVLYDSGPQYDVDFKADSWASRLAWQLEAAGLKQVSVLQGGINKWLEEERPVETGDNQPESAPERSLQEVADKFVDQSQVIEALEDDRYLIIDVLDEAQFSGEVAPFGEDRAGHIPGAKNIFYGSLTDESGDLLDESMLKERFDEIGALDEDKHVIVYCGFGVAASYVARAIESLGQDNVSVYDGSLQEWTENHDLPLEK